MVSCQAAPEPTQMYLIVSTCVELLILNKIIINKKNNNKVIINKISTLSKNAVLLLDERNCSTVPHELNQN